MPIQGLAEYKEDDRLDDSAVEINSDLIQTTNSPEVKSVIK